MAPALRQDARGCSPGLLQAKRGLLHARAAHLRNPLLRSINRQQRSTFSQPGPCARRALCIRSAAAADASDAGEPRCMRSVCEMTWGYLPDVHVLAIVEQDPRLLRRVWRQQSISTDVRAP